jgi:geranylgeranyl diphosphate/geranylgeranyl-bacteriochlorophyllide a reductase
MARRPASAWAPSKDGVDLKKATADLRASSGLTDCETIRREGAPIPLKPLDRWDNGRDVVLAGDAAGVVAPSSGEGIYYAMVGGRWRPRRRRPSSPRAGRRT